MSPNEYTYLKPLELIKNTAIEFIYIFYLYDFSAHIRKRTKKKQLSIYLKS